MTKVKVFSAIIIMAAVLMTTTGEAQTPPPQSEYLNYDPFLKAIHDGQIEQVRHFIDQGADLKKRDTAGRTALLIAAFQSHESIFEILVAAGSDVNEVEYSQYDAVTIAAVANDVEMLRLALKLGGNPKNTTSPYQGTALIASAHLGHVQVVNILLEAGSNIDHVNNLGWTALLEAVILGDGGPNYVEIVNDLLAHGADKSIADRQGVTPLMHARQSNYREIEKLLR